MVFHPGKVEKRELRVVTGPHNGTAEYQVEDRVTKAKIGGQVQIIRAALRYKRVVCPVGRRAGKTTLRPFLWSIEQSFTPKTYYAAIATSSHVKAYESWKFAKEQLGGLVADSRGEPESQDRWIKTHPLDPDPDVLGPALMDDQVVGPKIRANLGKNEGGLIYFFSGAHPIYISIQGYTHPFDRFDLDEAHQLNRGILHVTDPMLLDSGGAMLVTGVPDIDSPGNDWFQEYFDRGNDPERQHRWHSINFPSFANPHLDKDALEEIVNDVLTEDDFQQQILAKFVSGSGSVFKNLDDIFVVKPRYVREHPSHTNLPPFASLLLSKARSDSLLCWIAEEATKPGHSYAMTVDFAGRTKTRDATAIEIFDMTENTQVALFVIRDMTSPNQLVWLEGIHAHYQIAEVHGDDTPEGAALMSFLRSRHSVGIRGHNFSAYNKAEYVKKGVFLFEMREVRLIDCAYQKAEFKAFRRITSESKDGKDGPVTYSHPPGKHDDTVTSFLQIAPSMSFGTRSVTSTPEKEQPLVDEAGKTSLEILAASDGIDLPAHLLGPADDPPTWDSVVLTRK